MKEDWSWGLWMASKPLCSGDMARNWNSQMEIFFPLQYLPSCSPSMSAVPSYTPLVSSMPMPSYPSSASSMPMLQRHSGNRMSRPPRQTTWHPPSIPDKIVLVPRQAGTVPATCHPDLEGNQTGYCLSSPEDTYRILPVPIS